MANRGAWAIAAMFGIGLALAGGSVWYHHGQGRQCLLFWGLQDAALIRHAPAVEVWELGPPPSPGDSADNPAAVAVTDALQVDGQPRRIVRRRSIEQARGLVHARHALIVDANYDWKTNSTGSFPPASPDAWTHALAFTQDQDSVVLLFDFATSRVRRLSRPDTAQLRSTIAAAEQALLLRELGLINK